MRSFDVIICGGGIIGPALGYGTARAGASTLMLDEGDKAFRAARGNFGLVWFHAKGLGCQAYSDWTRQSVDLYPAFSRQLKNDVGIDIDLKQNGGLEVCLSDEEAQMFKSEIETMASQSTDGAYSSKFIDPQQANEILNGLKLGPEVVGAVYCPLSGHVSPLKLLNALHAGFQKYGGVYQASSTVKEIIPSGEGFTIKTNTESFSCKRVVIAAGLGVTTLAPQVGLNIPVFPERGQILVSERIQPVLPLAISGIRQTEEGSILMGASNEDVGFNSDTTGAVTTNIAKRAVATFPVLGNLNLVRTWGALRVLTPDHNPVYDQSSVHPGAFAATSHSGVTLAATNVDCAADWILEGRAPELFQSFTSDRFSS